MRTVVWFLAGVLVLAACAPGGPPPGAAPGGPDQQAQVQRTLVLIGGRAPHALTPKSLREAGGAGNPRATYRAFNAALALNDHQNVPHPYLAEALPQLNSDTWRVFPDGRMETVYRLRASLTWHDGQPLTADAFEFAYTVYANPEFGLNTLPPVSYMESVSAANPRTVLIRWRQPYADADALVMADFPPLPRHLLGTPLAERDPEAFIALPYWTREYVGAGPYRLTRFEPDVFVEGTAFAGHALGRPRIEQVRITYLTDANVVLANLLAGAAHLATDSAFDLQQAVVLDREWREVGVVLRNPTGVRHVNVQMRPEFATPRSLLDLRVRQALAHATDRQSLADALTEGLGTVADTLVLPAVEYFADLDRAITKYPFDPRRAEQRLAEAGYARGPDGLFANVDGRLALEIAVAQGGRNEPEVQIMADGLRRLGIDAATRVIPRVQITEPFVLANFPGLLIGSHNGAWAPPLQRLRASELATPETRGRGGNYSGWTSPEAERLIQAYDTALIRSERNQHAVQLLKLVSEQLPIYALYYNLEFLAHHAGLRGPALGVSTDGLTWNLHEWSWQF